MTWVIVQQCKDCGGQGKLYGYNTTPNKCHECEGTGEKEWYDRSLSFKRRRLNKQRKNYSLNFHIKC